ncbi:hypothetical protein QTJ16_004280 [Diplocarpon rosae]|uniref:Vps72/YL1 C-terminal domain-containing protein n=1 Tax=Diplocarpon rosae TaxID=946125 RepID=A0AAD9SWU0_9HELO|nr:hypothetical protein QTJ16_004280 [Diplocarpon rosae]
MAEDEEAPGADTPARIDESEQTGSDSESEDEQPQVQWLATGREKRSTAGNRLSSLLQQEEEDDELELLFAEADDDAGFSDNEADSDVQMDSSSDEEDQGPAAGEDDMEGEKELQKQARAEKAKKRKLDGGMPKGFKKRVKIDPTASHAPPPRPKKKSERASWIPTAGEAPTRASARGTTKQSKEQLHMQMVDREIKRLNQLANMDKAAKAREAAKKPPMTQEDRLREAARVEKSNSKSLSRWEEAEQQREEEQLAKLAALKNRSLEGPVITWWSGLGEWVDGKLKKVGKHLVIEEKEKPTKKRKAAEMEEEGDSAVGSVQPEASTAGQETDGKTAESTVGLATEAGLSASVPKESCSSFPATKPALVSEQRSAPHGNPPPTPVREMRFQPPVPSLHYIPEPPNSSVLAPPAGLPLSAPPPPQNGFHRPYMLAPPVLDGSAPLLGFNTYPQPLPFTPLTPFPLNRQQPPPPPPPARDLPPPPPRIEHASCNYLILENFDDTAVKDKNVQMQIIFGRKFPKAPPSHELCAITGLPARYRDPRTGLPYHSAFAYKEIQKLKRSEYKWSKLVGCYVGLGTHAARGVPDRFLARGGAGGGGRDEAIDVGTGVTGLVGGGAAESGSASGSGSASQSANIH